MAVSILTDDDEQVKFGNDDGEITWSKRRRVAVVDPNKLNGPGYVIRVKHGASGLLLVEDFQNGGVSMNDPRNGGIGAWGCHLWRRVDGGPVEAFDLTARQDGDLPGALHGAKSPVRVLGAPRITNGYGKFSYEVDFRDGFTNPLVTVGYDWTVLDSGVYAWVTTTLHPVPANIEYWIKEPKFVAAVGPFGGPDFRQLGLFDAASNQLALWQLPTTGANVVNWQMPQNARTRCRWQASNAVPGLTFSVVAEAALGAGAASSFWEGSAYGYDGWAQVANGRPTPPGSCAGYCLDAGGLKRKWEGAKRGTEPKTAVFFHAWEGGNGYPDCSCSAVAWVPESWTVWVSFAVGAGWQL